MAVSLHNITGQPVRVSIRLRASADELGTARDGAGQRRRSSRHPRRAEQSGHVDGSGGPDPEWRDVHAAAALQASSRAHDRRVRRAAWTSGSSSSRPRPSGRRSMCRRTSSRSCQAPRARPRRRPRPGRPRHGDADRHARPDRARDGRPEASRAGRGLGNDAASGRAVRQVVRRGVHRGRARRHRAAGHGARRHRVAALHRADRLDASEHPAGRRGHGSSGRCRGHARRRCRHVQRSDARRQAGHAPHPLDRPRRGRDRGADAGRREQTSERWQLKNGDKVGKVVFVLPWVGHVAVLVRNRSGSSRSSSCRSWAWASSGSGRSGARRTTTRTTTTEPGR